MRYKRREFEDLIRRNEKVGEETKPDTEVVADVHPPSDTSCVEVHEEEEL
jgi:hypothetical protein